METIGTAAIEAVAMAGPGWIALIVAIIVIGIMLTVLVPVIKSSIEGHLDIARKQAEHEAELETRREDRKEAEERAREQRDVERSEMEGRWAAQNERGIAALEKSNLVMETVSKQIEALSMQMQDSKANSKLFGEKLADMSIKLDRMYEEVVK